MYGQMDASPLPLVVFDNLAPYHTTVTLRAGLQSQGFPTQHVLLMERMCL